MPRRGAKALLLISLAVVLVFLACLLSATEGHFVAQVVDLYVICQYARAMAQGHPFQYNPGEPPSTGATSLLHTAVLACAHGVGIHGEWLVAFAILLGAVLYVLAVLLARRLALRLAGEREGLLAGGLVALGGPVVWGFLYGSDTGPFMILCLWLLEGLILVARGGEPNGLIWAGSLLALARPEGLPIVAAAALAVSWWRKGQGPTLGQARPFVPVAVGLAVLALNRGLTGQWLGTSLADKSLFANYAFGDSLALVSEYLVDVVRGLLLGFYPSPIPVGFAQGWGAVYFPPLGLLFVLAALVRPSEDSRFTLRLWALIVACVFVLFSPNVFMGVHFNRHLLWALPTLLVLASLGLGSMARLLARGDPALESGLFRAGAGLWLALGLLSTLRFAALYGEMAGEVYRRDVKTAEWIVKNLPPGVAMANVATSVEYLTRHHNLNLHGVTTPGFFGNHTAEREAGVFEALGRLPTLERPTYLITTVATQEANASLRELTDGPPLYRSLSLGDEILIQRMRYDVVGKNRRLFLPEVRQAVAELREVDRLNVCDSLDESLHAYSFASSLGGLALHGTARVEAYSGPPADLVVDGGRVILGHESFDVKTMPGRDLVIVLRTAGSAGANVLRAGGRSSYPLELPEAGIRVEANGQEAGRFSFRARQGWDEVVLRVVGSLVKAERTRLTLTGRYASFYYWFFQ